MATLFILGAGGHGTVVLDAALGMKRWDKIFFLDDAQHNPVLGQYQVLGKTSEMASLADGQTEVVVGVGDNLRRMELISDVESCQLSLAMIIHPSAIISRFAEIQKGSVVFANAVINPRAYIGRGSIVNTASVVEHDCHLSECVHVAPNATVCGSVKIGRLSWIGAGAVVKENLVIGESVIVGAGAAVVKNIPSHRVVTGVPAEERK